MFSEKVTRLKVSKTLSLFFLIASFLLLFSGIVQGDLAPEFTLTDIDGNTFSLSDFRGKIVIIEFFSKYCWACVDEIPHLKTVYNEFGEEELVIISIGKWGNNTQLIDFRNKHEIPWIVAGDTEDLFTLYNCKGVPHLYLIDHEGAITYDHNGIVEASVIVEKVNELLTLVPEPPVTPVPEPPVTPVPEPPVISVLFPENKTYSVTDVSLTFIVSEPTSWIGFSLDGQANVTISGNTTLTGLLDGVHYVVVYASDTAGNMGSSNLVQFTIDTTPPDIKKVSQIPLKNNVLPEDEVKVNATVVDDLSGVKKVVLNYTKGNGTWVTLSMTNLEENIWNANIPSFPYGTNTTYTIMAEDKAGNTVTTEKLGYESPYEVIPEFPSFLTLPLFMAATLLVVIIYKRKLFM